MNKIFTRVIGGALSLAMAIGVGISLAKSNIFLTAKADETPFYSLNCTSTDTYDPTQDANDRSNYTKYTYIIQDDMNWSAKANTTVNPWRIGGKNTTNTDRDIYSKTPMAADISNVTIKHSGIGNGKDSSITVNSIKLDISSKNDFSDSLFSKTISSPDVSQAGEIAFEPAAPATSWAKNSYYKITVNYKITGSNNCYLKLSGIDFYEYVVPGTLSVSYQANDKTSGTVPTDSKLYNEGDTVTVKNPDGGDLDKTGYVFDGWRISGEESNVGTTFTMPSTDVTLVAQWAAASNVVYHANNGTEEANVTEKAKTGSTYTVLDNSETAFTAPTDKEFAGWKLNAEGTGDFVSESFTLAKNTDLYAVWTPKGGTVLKPYTVAEFIDNYVANADVYVTGYIVDWYTYKNIDYALIADSRTGYTQTVEIFGASSTDVTFSGCNEEDYVEGSKIVAHGPSTIYNSQYETKNSVVTSIVTKAYEDASNFEINFILKDIPYPASTPTGVEGTDCLSTSEGGKGYYDAAIAEYTNNLDASAKAEFGKNAAFANARERFIAWAKANQHTMSFDPTTGEMILSSRGLNAFTTSVSGGTIATIAIVLTSISLVALGGFLVIRRKKEQ